MPPTNNQNTGHQQALAKNWDDYVEMKIMRSAYNADTRKHQ